MIFDQLINFMDSNVNARIMQRAGDVTLIMHKSFTDLDEICKFMARRKLMIYIDKSFKV